MSNFPPGVAPSSRSWLGIAREIGGNGSSGQGQPVLPTATIPLDKSSYETSLQQLLQAGVTSGLPAANMMLSGGAAGVGTRRWN